METETLATTMEVVMGAVTATDMIIGETTTEIGKDLVQSAQIIDSKDLQLMFVILLEVSGEKNLLCL